MNQLQIGLTEKHFDSDEPFLLLDDEPDCTGAELFNPRNHFLNPLPMTYKEAREFAETVYGSEGENTLTVRNGKRSLTRMLQKADRLDRLKGTTSDADKEALALVDDLLQSPVLKRVLCSRHRNFSFKDKSVCVRLNRAEIGDFDAFILGSIIIRQFKRQIIIHDGGFYLRPFHTSLIRENRLMVGVNTLAELDDRMRQMCLLMPKVGRHCTYNDAVVLANYAGHRPDHTREDNPYNRFIREVME